jgi:hypothetical protein
MAEIPNYQGNSKKAKEEPSSAEEKPKMEQVTTGKVVDRKQPLGKRIAATFQGDDAHSVGQFILFDVVMPAVKATISDVVSQGVDRLMYGDSRARSARPVGSGRAPTSYNRPVGSTTVVQQPAARTMSQRGRATHDFREIILEQRGEGEIVLNILRDAIEKYNFVSVSDMYAAVGITGTWADDKWGWFDLRDAGIRPIRGGYLLDLPPTEEITK